MENTLWKLLAFILCGLLLFLAPIMSLLDRQDDIAYNVVFTECNRFVDACRDTGYITPDMYSEFLSRLSATGNTYQIKLSHIKRAVNPVYMQQGRDLVFSGEYEVTHITASQSEILDVLFPEGSNVSTQDKMRYYTMGMGDLLFVEVQNKGKTMATAIRDMVLFSDTRAPAIFVRAGGMVRNEAD